MFEMLRFLPAGRQALSMTINSFVILNGAQQNEGSIIKNILMKPIGTHNYFVYITTNKNKTVLYTGVTNDLKNRLWEHEEDTRIGKRTFAGKYNCYNLIYFERYDYIEHAIDREKQIKGWKRIKKEELINNLNPEWKFLNQEIREDD